MRVRFGREVCGNLDAASEREWLVTDGLGGFAMGTVGGLRTRRYHGLLMVATRPPGGRMLGLADLDAIITIGERRIALGVHEWASGAVDPTGHVHIESFTLEDGLPRWRWAIGDVVVERELAMAHGRSAVGVIHRVVQAPAAVHLELRALCTWRDAHGERFAGAAPAMATTATGFDFEGAYRVSGVGFEPGGEWYRDVRYRVEAERGLTDREDLWHAGSFAVDLRAGESHELVAWSAPLDDAPPPASEIVRRAAERSATIHAAAHAEDEVSRLLAIAADQFIVAGPTVVAGYPWFGDWSRDTMTSYEGLFLETGRAAEGRQLLLRMAGTLSEGMLSNTADAGETEYNTADATLWFLHAVGRHVERTGDTALAADLSAALVDVIDRHVAGTRFGIRVDPANSLLTQGADGYALTWMDARVDGRPITQRAGKAVEINALWINGVATVAGIEERLGRDASGLRTLEKNARDSFVQRFPRLGGCADVVDPDNLQVRPNCLLALSLPYAPLSGPNVVRAVAPELLTSLGLRSLAPSDPSYLGLHRGGPRERDAAYHQGTVWPWLIGPYVEAALKAEVPVDGLLDGLDLHLYEWGLGSVSETADGDAPHRATGCPMQAWSVAELQRAHGLMRSAR
jgi:predicted glycogen debranching enzyme